MPLAKARAAASLGPPAGVGTISRMGLPGNPVWAPDEVTQIAMAPITMVFDSRFMLVLRLGNGAQCSAPRSAGEVLRWT